MRYFLIDEVVLGELADRQCGPDYPDNYRGLVDEFALAEVVHTVAGLVGIQHRFKDGFYDGPGEFIP